MRFQTPPNISLVRVALKGRGDTSRGLPRTEATAERVSLDAGAYAEVCGFTTPGVPITWPDVACRGLQLTVLTAPEFPFRVMGLVHTRQRIERKRLVGPGESLGARVIVDGLRGARRGAEFDLTTELLAGDEVVWRGVSSLLTRGVAGDGVRREVVEQRLASIERSAQWALPADLGRRYARVSGDYNPIHLSPLTSKLFGFSQPIAHGWWSLARCLAQLGDLPAACVIDASFRKPIPLPSAVRFDAGPVAGVSGIGFSLTRDEVCLSGLVRFV